MTGNVKALEKSSLVAIETKLGWVFSGPIDIPHSTNMNVSTSSEAHVVLMLDNKAKTGESHLSRYEVYLCNLRETCKPNKSRITLPIIEVNDIVIVHVEKLPRSQWKLGLVTKLIPS